MPEQTVLIVEDELLVSMDMADLFEQAGFTVYEATSAEDALAVLERERDINIVFTDVNMPGSLSGLKLAAMVEARWPATRLTVTSAHYTPQSGKLPERIEFFSKLYSAQKVIDAAHRLLS